ncbi:Hypothetical predicted protein [Paramuricea clavata]|nr:Hypothetical predicted protein [Paramuricea clavata]
MANVLWNILIFTAWLGITASAFSQNDKVQKLEQEIKSQAKKIQSQEGTIQGIVDSINRLHPTGSCSILKQKRPSTLSGVYKIYLRGLTSSVKVHCDMSSKNGVGVTEIGQDSESRTRVNGYEAPGSYNRTIKYDLPMEQIVAIIQQSQWCEQFIKYECYHSKMWIYSQPYSWWVSRKGAKMNYWGGAAVGSEKCACGMTNSCAGGERRCNCDKNDFRLREDSGYLRDKDTLPVTELRFGETGSSSEYGYHTLGKLRCWG